LVEEGDRIEIDIPARRIHLDVSEETLAERRARMQTRAEQAWQPVQRERPITAALRAYAALTTSAAHGAVRDVSRVGG